MYVSQNGKGIVEISQALVTLIEAESLELACATEENGKVNLKCIQKNEFCQLQKRTLKEGFDIYSTCNQRSTG